MKNPNKVYGALLIALYSFLVLVPLIILLAGPKFISRPALLDLSVSLAFFGLAVMAMQFILTARIKSTHKPFGTDLVYYFHRQIGIAAFMFVFSHPVLLFVLDGRYLRLLNFFLKAFANSVGHYCYSAADRRGLDGSVPAKIENPLLVLEAVAWDYCFSHDPSGALPYFHRRQLYRLALEKNPVDYL